MFREVLEAVSKWYLTALGLVALYLIATHANELNTLAKTGAKYALGSFVILQGRSIGTAKGQTGTGF